VVVEDVELLEPGPHEVQVRWVANGVCHGDLHVIHFPNDRPRPGDPDLDRRVEMHDVAVPVASDEGIASVGR
jgi:threonine dehydrogenase-like Zn-dependent dehydrogenase